MKRDSLFRGGTARFHGVDDGGLGAIGTVVGLTFGFAITWYVAGRTKDRS